MPTGARKFAHPRYGCDPIQTDERVDKSMGAGRHWPHPSIEDDDVAGLEECDGLAATFAVVAIGELIEVRVEVGCRTDERVRERHRCRRNAGTRRAEAAQGGFDRRVGGGEARVLRHLRPLGDRYVNELVCLRIDRRIPGTERLVDADANKSGAHARIRATSYRVARWLREPRGSVRRAADGPWSAGTPAGLGEVALGHELVRRSALRPPPAQLCYGGGSALRAARGSSTADLAVLDLAHRPSKNADARRVVRAGSDTW